MRGRVSQILEAKGFSMTTRTFARMQARARAAEARTNALPRRTFPKSLSHRPVIPSSPGPESRRGAGPAPPLRALGQEVQGGPSQTRRQAGETASSRRAAQAS
eukprot:1821970-Pyramimonas_sp.AAC.1